MEKVDVDLEFQEIPNTFYKAELKVLPDASVNVILEAKFLIKNKRVIDYKEQTFSMRNNPIELLSTSAAQWKNNPDRKLAKATKSYSLTDAKQRAKLNQLISTLKAKNPPLGEFRGFQHNIRLKSKQPATENGFEIPYPLREQTKLQIERLLSGGVIRRSTSPFNASAFPVLKRNGKLRIVVNYRQLNGNTINETTNIPSMQKLLAGL